MGLEFTNGQMVEDMKVDITKIKNKAMEFITGLMAEDLKGNGATVRGMDQVSWYMQMVQKSMGYG